MEPCASGSDFDNKQREVMDHKSSLEAGTQSDLVKQLDEKYYSFANERVKERVNLASDDGGEGESGLLWEKTFEHNIHLNIDDDSVSFDFSNVYNSYTFQISDDTTGSFNVNGAEDNLNTCDFFAYLEKIPELDFKTETVNGGSDISASRNSKYGQPEEERIVSQHTHFIGTKISEDATDNEQEDLPYDGHSEYTHQHCPEASNLHCKMVSTDGALRKDLADILDLVKKELHFADTETGQQSKLRADFMTKGPSRTNKIHDPKSHETQNSVPPSGSATSTLVSCKATTDRDTQLQPKISDVQHHAEENLDFSSVHLSTCDFLAYLEEASAFGTKNEAVNERSNVSASKKSECEQSEEENNVLQHMHFVGSELCDAYNNNQENLWCEGYPEYIHQHCPEISHLECKTVPANMTLRKDLADISGVTANEIQSAGTKNGQNSKLETILVTNDSLRTNESHGNNSHVDIKSVLLSNGATHNASELMSCKATTDVDPPIQSKISDVLLRHFAKEDLVFSANKYIDCETIPEISCSESIDETLFSYTDASKCSKNTIRLSSKAETTQNNISKDAKEGSGTDCFVGDALNSDRVTFNKSSNTGNDQKEHCSIPSRDDQRSHSLNSLTHGEQHKNEQNMHSDKEMEPSPNLPLVKSVSYNEIKYGQGQVHYPLPDFSKVAPKVKIPKSNSTTKHPRIKKANSSPSLLTRSVVSQTGTADVVREILESMQQPEDFFDAGQIMAELTAELEFNHHLKESGGVDVYNQNHASPHGIIPLSSDVSTLASQPAVLQAVHTKGLESTKGEKMTLMLSEETEQFKIQLEKFKECLISESLSIQDQQKVLKTMTDCLDKLERNYRAAKEDHRRLQLQNFMGKSTTIGEFDLERQVEGQIFKLGMDLETIKEMINENVHKHIRQVECMQPASKVPPSSPAVFQTSTVEQVSKLESESVLGISKANRSVTLNQESDHSQQHLEGFTNASHMQLENEKTLNVEGGSSEVLQMATLPSACTTDDWTHSIFSSGGDADNKGNTLHGQLTPEISDEHLPLPNPHEYANDALLKQVSFLANQIKMQAHSCALQSAAILSLQSEIFTLRRYIEDKLPKLLQISDKENDWVLRKGPVKVQKKQAYAYNTPTKNKPPRLSNAKLTYPGKSDEMLSPQYPPRRVYRSRSAANSNIRNTEIIKYKNVDVASSLDQAVETASNMKKTTERMVQTLSADLLRVESYRKLYRF